MEHADFQSLLACNEVQPVNRACLAPSLPLPGIHVTGQWMTYRKQRMVEQETREKLTSYVHWGQMTHGSAAPNRPGLQRNLNPNLDPPVESMSPCEACWPPISLPQIWVEWSDYDDTWISKLVKQMMFHLVFKRWSHKRDFEWFWWMAWRCMKPSLRIATFCGGANMASAFVGKLVCRRKPIRWKLWRGRESASSSRRVPREAGCM